MEPRKDESEKGPKPGKEKKERRFQIVKLEERIAPAKGNSHPCTRHATEFRFTC